MMEGEGEEEGGREGEGVMSFFDVRFCVGWDLFFFFSFFNGTVRIYIRSEVMVVMVGAWISRYRQTQSRFYGLEILLL